MTGHFTGECETTLDAKNRVVLPSKYRKEIDFEAEGRKLYVSLHPDGCLVICPPTEWKRRLALLNENPFPKRDVRRFREYLSSKTEQAKCDKQGRLRLDPNLTEQAKIEREVTLVGNISEIRVWSKEGWKKRSEECRQYYQEDIEALS